MLWPVRRRHSGARSATIASAVSSARAASSSEAARVCTPKP